MQDLFVGGGAGSSVANTDKSVSDLQGNQCNGYKRCTQDRTDTSNADSNKKNIVIDLDQSSNQN